MGGGGGDGGGHVLGWTRDGWIHEDGMDGEPLEKMETWACVEMDKR